MIVQSLHCALHGVTSLLIVGQRAHNNFLAKDPCLFPEFWRSFGMTPCYDRHPGRACLVRDTEATGRDADSVACSTSPPLRRNTPVVVIIEAMLPYGCSL